MTMEHDAPPPPPPPHGSSPRPPGGLPDGNYDIFIIPPHSAGSGFLYLPSMTPNRNSFLAGVACTLFAVGLYTIVVPTVKQWMHAVQQGGGGLGVLTLVIVVGVSAWAWGKTQAEGGPRFDSENGSGAGASGHHQRSQHTRPPPDDWRHTPPPPPPPQPPPQPPPPPPQPESQSAPPPKPEAKPNSAASGWEKAREETRRREEERKRAEELKRKREEAAKVREEAERAAKAKAEKEKWEQARAREKETREREARERIAREREQRLKEQREKEQKEREARDAGEKKKSEWEKARQAEREKAERIRAAAAASVRSDSPKATKPSEKYERPTARSHAGTDTAYSYRPYDKPKTAASSASSISGLSESSYAPSMSTARTTPPPSHRGPYTTDDPDKIKILTVALFSDSSPNKPISQLVANEGPVTDGLILNIRTAGLFIDDDVRGVPQREWDVKAWTLKLVEDGMVKLPKSSLHVLRATTRDTENKKYCFVLDESEAWKVAVGLQRLRKGSQVRSLGMNGMKESEVKGLLATLGWL